MDRDPSNAATVAADEVSRLVGEVPHSLSSHLVRPFCGHVQGAHLLGDRRRRVGMLRDGVTASDVPIVALSRLPGTRDAHVDCSASREAGTADLSLRSVGSVPSPAGVGGVGSARSDAVRLLRIIRRSDETTLMRCKSEVTDSRMRVGVLAADSSPAGHQSASALLGAEMTLNVPKQVDPGLTTRRSPSPR